MSLASKELQNYDYDYHYRSIAKAPYSTHHQFGVKRMLMSILRKKIRNKSIGRTQFKVLNNAQNRLQ